MFGDIIDRALDSGDAGGVRAYVRPDGLELTDGDGWIVSDVTHNLEDTR